MPGYHRAAAPAPRGVAVSPGEIALLGLAIVATACTLALALTNPAAWDHLGREDGPVENADVVAFLLLAVVAARRFLRSPRGARAPSLAAMLLGVVGAGEEISWGQRIFAVAPPPFFAHHNVQGEINLHNLIPPPWDAVLAVVLFLGFCSSPLWRDRSWARMLARRGLPWPRFVHVAVLVACVTASLAVALITQAKNLEEVGELVFVLTVAAVWHGHGP